MRKALAIDRIGLSCAAWFFLLGWLLGAGLVATYAGSLAILLVAGWALLPVWILEGICL